MSEKPKGGLAEFVEELRREPLRHRIEAAADRGVADAYAEALRDLFGLEEKNAANE